MISSPARKAHQLAWVGGSAAGAMRGTRAARVASPDWSALQEAIRAGDVPSFLAELRRELLDGSLTIGTLHTQLQSCCFAKVSQIYPRLPPANVPHLPRGWCSRVYGRYSDRALHVEKRGCSTCRRMRLPCCPSSSAASRSCVLKMLRRHGAPMPWLLGPSPHIPPRPTQEAAQLRVYHQEARQRLRSRTVGPARMPLAQQLHRTSRRPLQVLYRTAGTGLPARSHARTCSMPSL